MNSQQSSDGECSSEVDNARAQFSEQPMTAEEAALLSSRLLHSEETQKDMKEELSKVRRDCMRRQGAEVSHFLFVCFFVYLHLLFIVVIIVNVQRS